MRFRASPACPCSCRLLPPRTALKGNPCRLAPSPPTPQICSASSLTAPPPSRRRASARARHAPWATPAMAAAAAPCAPTPCPSAPRMARAPVPPLPPHLARPKGRAHAPLAKQGGLWALRPARYGEAARDLHSRAATSCARHSCCIADLALPTWPTRCSVLEWSAIVLTWRPTSAHAGCATAGTAERPTAWLAPRCASLLLLGRAAAAGLTHVHCAGMECSPAAGVSAAAVCPPLPVGLQCVAAGQSSNECSNWASNTCSCINCKAAYSLAAGVCTAVSGCAWPSGALAGLLEPYPLNRTWRAPHVPQCSGSQAPAQCSGYSSANSCTCSGCKMGYGPLAAGACATCSDPGPSRCAVYAATPAAGANNKGSCSCE